MVRGLVTEELSAMADEIASTLQRWSTEEGATIWKSAVSVGDEDLMVAVQAHDGRALKSLYLRYFGRLVQFLLRFTADGGQIEAMIDDIFVDVWRDAKEFRFTSRVSAWIFQSAYRIAISSGGRGPLRSLLLTDSQQSKEQSDCGLTGLSVEQLATVALAYQMRFSLQEIGMITSCSIDTINSHMLQARSGLRDSVESGMSVTP
jgi:DNA-directed RNA polymerase specialized sigma24 family protein